MILKHKKVFSNIGYLGFLNILNICSPIFLYPYLINTLGMKKYGLFILSQTIAQLLSSVISFGFNLSATRDISFNRNNKDEISYIFCNVFYAKIVFSIFISFFYCVYIINFISKEQWVIYFLSFGFIFYELFFPLWLFQGLDNMRNVAIINSIGKIIPFLLVFLFVHNPNDVLILSVIYFISNLMIGILSFYLAFKISDLYIVPIDIKAIIKVIKKSWYLFLGLISTSIREKISVILIAKLLDDSAVVIYDLGIRILSILSIPQNIISTAFYPTISKTQDKKLAVNILFIVVVVSILIIFVSYFFVNNYIHFFISGINSENKDVIKILMLSILPISISTILARLFFAAFSLDKLYFKTIYITLLFYFFSFFVYILINDSYSLTDISLIIMLVFCFESILRGIMAFRIKRG